MHRQATALSGVIAARKDSRLISLRRRFYRWLSIFALSVVLSFVAGNIIWSETVAYQERSVSAGDARQMADDLGQMAANMSWYGMTRGHAALFIKNPDNDMASIYRSVCQNRDRLLEALKLDQTTPIGSLAYDVRMADVRRSMQHLSLHAWKFWMLHSFPGTVLSLSLVISFIMLMWTTYRQPF